MSAFSKSSGLHRRAWLTGAGAALFGGTASASDEAAKSALDGALHALQAGGKPADALAQVRAIALDGLSPARALDVRAALKGLALEAAVAEAKGDAVYPARLSLAMGAPTSPNAARAEALREIAALNRRGEALLRILGAWRGDVARDLAAFMTRADALYPDDATGRAAAVSDMARRLEAARPKLAPAFDVPLPGASFRCLTPEEERAKRGGHRTAEGYVVDLTEIRRRPAWTLTSVTFHETIPGHLLQARAQGEVHPLRQRYAGAFSEAWATYAEQLANDLGVYAGDPAGELGYIHWRLFRMARIVVDIGLNAHGWSDVEGLQTLAAIQGAPIAFATFMADVARMRQTPGVFASQGLGALRVRTQRPLAKRRWPGYHAVLLRNGPVPLAML